MTFNVGFEQIAKAVGTDVGFSAGLVLRAPPSAAWSFAAAWRS